RRHFSLIRGKTSPERPGARSAAGTGPDAAPAGGRPATRTMARTTGRNGRRAAARPEVAAGRRVTSVAGGRAMGGAARPARPAGVGARSGPHLAYPDAPGESRRGVAGTFYQFAVIANPFPPLVRESERAHHSGGSLVAGDHSSAASAGTKAGGPTG